MLKNNPDFNHIDKITRKGLTNPNYYRVLGIIGQSEELLDNNKIIENFEEMYGPSNKYIYDILKELCPSNQEIHDDLLFVWEDLLKCDSSKLENQCKNILYKTNQKWTNFNYDSHFDSTSNPKYLTIFNGKSLSDSDKWIKVLPNKKNSEFFNPRYNYSMLIITFSNKELNVFPTFTKLKNKKLHVYSSNLISLKPRQFLDVIIDEHNLLLAQEVFQGLLQVKAESSINVPSNLSEWFIKLSAYHMIENTKLNEDELKLLNSSKKINQIIEKYNKIIRNRRYWKYTLNFRGLLLYLILFDSYKFKHTARDKKIFSKVLSNPSLTKIAPFLEFPNEIEQFGFNGKKVAITIADELRNQLHIDIDNDTFLSQRFTERFYSEFEKVTRYFRFLKLESEGDEFHKYEILENRINTYLKKIIFLQIKFIENKEEIFRWILKELNLI